MRLRFVAVATSLLGVGADAEAPEVSLALPSTEAIKNNNEERVLFDHVGEEIIETVEKQTLHFKPVSESQPSSKRFKTSQNEPLSAGPHLKNTDQDQVKDVSDHHVNHITNRQYTLDEIFQNVYRDEAVAKMKNAETNLYDAFIKIRDVDPNIFKSPMLKLFIKQANDFINDYPDANLNLVDLMRLDAKTLLDMADAAFDNPRGSTNVKKVLEALRHSWSLAKLTPDGLSILLGLNLDKNKNSNFETLRFKEWMDYFVKFEKAQKLLVHQERPFDKP